MCKTTIPKCPICNNNKRISNLSIFEFGLTNKPPFYTCYYCETLFSQAYVFAYWKGVEDEKKHIKINALDR